MNNRIRKSLTRSIVFTIAVAFAPIGLAQTSSDQTTMQDVKSEAADVAKAIKKYSANQKDQAIESAKSALNELDARIEKLETTIEQQSDKMTEAARENARKTMKALREQRNSLAEWYGGMKHSSNDAWEHVKEGFSESYSALTGAWDKARKEFADGGA